ncbi:MAG: hypothetical protein V3V16_10805 [Melioribacteraceae bacterium]
MIKTIINIFLIFFIIVPNLIGQSKFDSKIKLDNHKYFEERNIEVVISKNSEEQYRIKNQLSPYYSIPEVAVFENGNSVLIFSVESVLEFYSNGVLQKQIKLLEDDLYNESSILFSADKNKIALLITEEQKNKVILLTDSGEEIFAKSYQDGFGSGIVFSETNNFLAVSINNWDNENLISRSVFTDYKNNTETIFPYNFENGDFYNNSTLFLGQSNSELFLLDLNTNKILWNKKANNKTIFLQSRIKNNVVLVIKADRPTLTNGLWNYKKAKIISFDRNGHEEEIQTINKSFRSLDIVEDEQGIAIKTNNDLIKIN